MPAATLRWGEAPEWAIATKWHNKTRSVSPVGPEEIHGEGATRNAVRTPRVPPRHTSGSNVWIFRLRQG